VNDCAAKLVAVDGDTGESVADGDVALPPHAAVESTAPEIATPITNLVIMNKLRGAV
jgi:hypothetical protein